MMLEQVIGNRKVCGADYHRFEIATVATLVLLLIMRFKTNMRMKI
jgi:hypothetical protein